MLLTTHTAVVVCVVLLRKKVRVQVNPEKKKLKDSGKFRNSKRPLRKNKLTNRKTVWQK